jgi:cytochrome c peroxidase
MNQQKLLKIGVILGLVALSFPLSNLVPRPQRPDSPIVKYLGEKHAKVAQVFETKCLDCHTRNTVYPWYFNLPVANSVIMEDVNAGIQALNLDTTFSKPLGSPLSPDALSEIEEVIQSGEMPPLKYTALHWNAFVSADEKEAILSWIQKARKSSAATGVAPEFTAEPIQPLTPVDYNKEKASLGNKLFHDPLLSKDNTVSCASCHALDKGGTDRAQFSTGVGGAKGGINSPTVYNAVFNTLQFWDGRAKDLVEQAGGPVGNPIEMASHWPDVVKKVAEKPDYNKAFQALFKDGVTQQNIQSAIAEFEKTLVTVNSPFDRYLKRDKTALSAQAIKGYETFKSVGCITCHTGPAVGGGQFKKMSLYGDYFKDRGTLTKEDNGRFNVTQNPQDRHVFKVPSLRNVALTGPYYHDGTVKTLEEAIDKMAKYQLGKPLKPEETANIKAFLESLTGEYQGKPLQ